MDEFFMPFGGRLMKDNRWVRLAEMMPWDVLCKGWFHHPNTHWLMVHLWQDDAGRKGGDRPAGGNRSGSAQDDLGAPFSLSALSKSALTHHRQAGGSTACGRRALSGGGSAGVSSPAGIYQQTPTAACASDAAAPITGGLGAIGHQQAAPGIYRCIACHYYQCL